MSNLWRTAPCGQGKRLFGAISCLVTPNDLENLTEKLRFIVNMNTEEFHHGLEDLIKLRIVERFENGFFPSVLG